MPLDCLMNNSVMMWQSNILDVLESKKNAKALGEVASFYRIAKKNQPLSLYYYQKAAANNNTGVRYLINAFDDRYIHKMGYDPNPELVKLYQGLSFTIKTLLLKSTLASG